MSYIELAKIYYRDEEKYNTEYINRFNSQDTIKLNFKINGNQAFFVQNAEVASIVFQILKTDKNVSLISNGLPEDALEQYSKMCLIDEIVLSNKIEGVYSTRREIASILSELEYAVSEKNKKRKRFWGLVNQYFKLRTENYASVKSCEDVRRLYDELVLPEVIEEDPKNAPDGKLFRKESTSVYSATDKPIHRGTYPESMIISEMEDALSFLHDESIEPIYRIAVFHYLFEYIHPFYDGNGRLGRFIMSNMMAQEFNPLLSYRLSNTITGGIKRYYDAFEICNNERNLGDVTPFLIMMLNMIYKSMSELEEALQVKQKLLTQYREKIITLPNGKHERTHEAYYVLIQAGLFSENGISTNEFSAYLRSSYTTAKKELDFIESHHMLIKNRVGREIYYRIDLEELDSYFNEGSTE